MKSFLFSSSPQKKDAQHCKEMLRSSCHCKLKCCVWNNPLLSGESAIYLNLACIHVILFTTKIILWHFIKKVNKLNNKSLFIHFTNA